MIERIKELFKDNTVKGAMVIFLMLLIAACGVAVATGRMEVLLAPFMPLLYLFRQKKHPPVKAISFDQVANGQKAKVKAVEAKAKAEFDRMTSENIQKPIKKGTGDLSGLLDKERDSQ